MLTAGIDLWGVKGVMSHDMGCRSGLPTLRWVRHEGQDYVRLGLGSRSDVPLAICVCRSGDGRRRSFDASAA